MRQLSFAILLLFSQLAMADHHQSVVKELDQMLANYIELFNANDAAGLANTYTVNASQTTTAGEHFSGREAIKKSLIDFFKQNPGIRIEIENVTRHFVQNDVVVEDGAWREIGGASPDAAGSGHYTAVLVKQDGKWLNAVERNFIYSSTSDVQSALLKLKRFVGTWKYRGKQNDPPVEGLPFGPAGKFSGTQVSKMILKDKVLQTTGTDKNPGGETEVLDVTRYDSATKTFLKNNYTSDGTAEQSEEVVSDDGRVWTSKSVATTTTGERVLIKAVTKFSKDWNQINSVVEVSDNDGKSWKPWYKSSSQKVSKRN